MENDSQTENITNWFIMSLLVLEVGDLGCHVAWCPTTGEDILSSICKSGESEISNHTFITLLVSEYDILWFEISVHDP